MNRVGLALGGGGARGFAHAGVLMALEEAGVRPSMLAGTSMGALVGAMYAVGQDMDRLMRVVAALNLHAIFGIPESYRRTLERTVGEVVVDGIRGVDWRQSCSPRLLRLYQFLYLFCRGRRFEELSIPFAAVSADVMTGQEVVLTHGPLYRGVAASAALPAVFQPVPWGGRHLIDGGVVNNVPADVVAAHGVDRVLAVDVSVPLIAEPTTTADVLLQSYTITARELCKMKLERVRREIGDRLIVVQPEIDEIGLLDFHRVEDAVEIGKDAARATLATLAG